MNATVQHWHHHNQTDDLTITGYPDNDPSLGVVLLLDAAGHPSVDVATALEPWTGGVA